MTEREGAPSPLESGPPAGEPQNEIASDKDDRRELLKRLGRYGLYTAPVLLSLFVSDKAPSQSCPC